MNHQERQHIVNTTNNGNHINADAPTYHAETIIVVECPTCGDLAPEKYIKATGQCENCVNDFYQTNYPLGN